MSKKGVNISTEQKKCLLEFLKKEPNLLTKKFSANFTFKNAQQKWEEATDILNSIPGGATKDWKAWRKTWQDIRSRTKSKKNILHKFTVGTGGGQSLLGSISKDDEDVLEIIEKVCVDGHTNISESVCHLNLEETEMDMEAVAEKFVDLPSTSTNVHHSVGQPSKLKMPRKPGRSTLQESVSAVDRFSKGCEEKLQLKKVYYEKKLELLERMAVSRERIATALELIADSIS